MSQIIDQVQAALQNIDKELEKYPALKQLEKQIREYYNHVQSSAIIPL